LRAFRFGDIFGRPTFAAASLNDSLFFWFVFLDHGSVPSLALSADFAHAKNDRGKSASYAPELDLGWKCAPLSFTAANESMRA